MDKMLFELEQTNGLFTPTIIPGGLNETNPILTTRQVCHLDDNEIDFSELVSSNQSYDNSDERRQQEDLFSTIDLPTLTELNRPDSTFDGIQLEKYISHGSFPTPEMDLATISMSEDSTFYPIEDEDSSTNLWVGHECTVDSKSADDMTVPPSPPLSSDGRISKTKKRHLSAVERKLRKKGQNKTAAEKYRLKKRTEKGDLITRHTDLKNQNQELKFQLENLTFQLEQFKQLFVDVLQIPLPSNTTPS